MNLLTSIALASGIASALPPALKAELETFTTDGVQVAVDTEGFVFSLSTEAEKVALPSTTANGLTIDDQPLAQCSKDSTENNAFTFSSADQRQGAVEFLPFENGMAIRVSMDDGKPAKISLTTGGMGPAYGLGDHGSYLPSADLSLSGKNHQLFNNGGGNRWISSFVVFPQRGTAGVVFDRNTMNVQVSRDRYRMEVSGSPSETFYYFHGTMPEVYQAYRKVRHLEGFIDVTPKMRLFELGWESWDALGWQTSADSVKDYLEKFNAAGYPLRWAGTGSGFWEDGGTTTSFGDWNTKKFKSHDSLHSWMQENDISWMIGQRTNFVALGGPHVPKGRQDRNAKMIQLRDGPFTSDGLSQNYFLHQDKTYRSEIFPLVPCHLLDGNASGSSEWFLRLYKKWEVDGIKEDTMITVKDSTIFNKPMATIAGNNGLVMARCGAFSAPGTLLRSPPVSLIRNMALRTPLNYLQYAACGAPNVYSDTVGFHSMDKYSDANIRHAWMCSLTAGMSVGKGPWKWPEDKQELFRKPFEFHYELGPYLHSAAIDGYRSGYPHTLTPLPIAFPAEEATYDLSSTSKRQFEWMIGPSLLATPLLNTKGKSPHHLDIYLPSGKWIDIETGTTHVGPTTLENFSMPLDKIPVFVGGKGVYVSRKDDESPLEAVVFPIANGGSKYEFTYPDGASQSVIENSNTGWNADTIVVTSSTTPAPIAFTTNAATGAIRFAIQPGSDYRLSGGN